MELTQQLCIYKIAQITPYLILWSLLHSKGLMFTEVENKDEQSRYSTYFSHC